MVSAETWLKSTNIPKEMKDQIIDFDLVSFEMFFWENCLPKRFISATTSNPNDDKPWLLATSEPVSAVVESAL